MARTPLLTSLLHLGRDHHAAALSGIPPHGVREARFEIGAPITRRRLLTGALLGGAGVLLDSPPPVAAASRARVAIVGGGISGLTAALRLHDLGVPCTVYEASTRLGGRMFSQSPAISGRPGYWDDGQVSEWCGELIDTDHRTIHALAHRFALPLDDLRTAQPAGATDTYFFDGAYYPAHEADRDFAPVYRALLRDARASGGDTTRAVHNAHGVMLDNMSLYDWIESRVPGGHRSRMGKLLDVAYATEYAADTRDQSSLNLVYTLNGSSADHLQIFGSSDERYHIRGGNQLLPLAIAKRLPAGSVRTGMRLSALAVRPAGGVILEFDSASGPVSVPADHVILTLPFATLRLLDLKHAGFDPRKLAAIHELGAGRSGKLMVQFRSRPWNTHGAGGATTGTSFSDLHYQNSWDVTRSQAGASGVLVGFTGGSATAQYSQPAAYTTADDPRSAAAAGAFVRELDRVFPGTGPQFNGKANLSLPSRDPHLRLSYSYWRVGQYHRFRGYERVAQGSIHFAGEHCSLDFQGFMEGAAREGLRAANEVFHRVRKT